jgi:hypothetical protein
MRIHLAASLVGVLALSACAFEDGLGGEDDLEIGSTANAVINLQGVNLQGVNLQGVNLQGVNLQGVNLQGVNLQGVNLQGVSLSSVTISGTYITGWRWNSTNGWWELRKTDQYLIYYNNQYYGPYMTGLEDSRFTGALSNGKSASLRIAPKTSGGIRVDPTTNSMVNTAYQSNSDVWQYKVQILADDGAWYNMCPGDGYGTIIAGSWSTSGAYSSGGYTYACTSGVISKCISQWGYKPWRSLGDSSKTIRNLQPLHQACTRAARADYCGDGIPHTENGTKVDMFDSYGFNQPETYDGLQDDEATYCSWTGTCHIWTWHGEAVFTNAGAVRVGSAGRLATSTDIYGDVTLDTGFGDLTCSPTQISSSLLDTVNEIKSYATPSIGILSRTDAYIKGG